MYIDLNGVLEYYYDSKGMIEIPENVRQLGDEIFLDRPEITAVTLHEGLEVIGDLAFCGSGITGIDLPQSVEWIGTGAFARCPDLKWARFPAVLDSVEDLSFYACRKLESVELPLILDRIGEEAFMKCSGLKEIWLPTTLDEIDTRSFAESGLTEIFIPASVTWIGDEAFDGCADLKQVTINSRCISIGENAFPEGVVIRAPFIEPEELPEKYRLMAAVGYIEWCAETNKLTTNHHTLEWYLGVISSLDRAERCYHFFIRTHVKELLRLTADHPMLAEYLVNGGLIPREVVENLKGSTLDVVETLFSQIAENFSEGCENDGGPQLH